MRPVTGLRPRDLEELNRESPIPPVKSRTFRSKSAHEQFVVAADGFQIQFANRAPRTVLRKKFCLSRYFEQWFAFLIERLLLKPALPEDAGLLTFSEMEACVQAGYDAAIRMLPSIRSLFSLKTA